MTEQNHRSLSSANEAEVVTQVIRARRKRTILFGELFADPAWDMMLELFLAELEGRRLATCELGYKANVPSTTSLRWTEKLEADGWLCRVHDPRDLRRMFVELSARGSEAMHVWLKEWPEQSSKRPSDDRVTNLLNRIGGHGS
jgi:DNA-binding MarR family transcriptional regulator